MPFEKGRTKTGGRKAGIPNRGTVEMKVFALELLEDPEYQGRLRARILNGEAPHMEVLLHHYTYGKPKTVHDVNDKHVTVIVNRNDDQSERPVEAPVLALPSEGSSCPVV